MFFKCVGVMDDSGKLNYKTGDGIDITLTPEFPEAALAK